MTEQPPIDDIASRPLPETAGADPNDLTPPDWKRTAMISWPGRVVNRQPP